MILFVRVCLATYLACLFGAQNVTASSQFKIYAYLPWKGVPVNLSDYGIQPIHVLYEKTYFTDSVIDENKIKNIALATLNESNIPVSFDMEFGYRFAPVTVIPDIKRILTSFRKYNSKSLLGLYATIPQNTYGKKPIGKEYEHLNNPYVALVEWVDYLSPSLYNYQPIEFDAWLQNAKYTMASIQHYPLQKPVIPYISPIVRLGSSSLAKNGNLVIELSEKEMSKRLYALEHLGAAGCIIWASSQDRTKTGQPPQFNPEKGWGKAVVEFIKAHQR